MPGTQLLATVLCVVTGQIKLGFMVLTEACGTRRGAPGPGHVGVHAMSALPMLCSVVVVLVRCL
jgi:hypothetical protein